MAEEVIVEQTQTEVATVEPQKAEVSVADDKSKLLSANPFESKQTLNDYFTMAKVLAGSTLVPQSYQGNPSNCLIALEQAQRMQCSPLMVMQHLTIVKGKPSWDGQACSMIVNGCGLFKSVKLNYVGEPGKENRGAFVSAIRNEDDAEIIGTTVDMNMAKAEGWTSNPKWKSMPEQMLGYRAYSFFARLHCPNALSGFATEGEFEDIEANKKKVASGSLNSLLMEN